MPDDAILSNVDDVTSNSAYEHVYVSPMETIREGSEDVHVRKYVVYPEPLSNVLYLEPTFDTKAKYEDSLYAFERGMLLVSVSGVDNERDGLYTPVWISESYSGGSIGVVNIGEGAIGATAYRFYNDEGEPS